MIICIGPSFIVSGCFCCSSVDWGGAVTNLVIFFLSLTSRTICWVTVINKIRKQKPFLTQLFHEHGMNKILTSALDL